MGEEVKHPKEEEDADAKEKGGKEGGEEIGLHKTETSHENAKEDKKGEEGRVCQGERDNKRRMAKLVEEVVERIQQSCERYSLQSTKQARQDYPQTKQYFCGTRPHKTADERKEGL